MNIFIPSIIAFLALTAVVVVVYILIKKQESITSQLIERDIRNLNLELKRERQSFFLPHRMEAYQRFILLMDRVTPANIVLRFHNPAYPAKKVQLDILEAIREEFNHNVAQQMFISREAWKMISEAKEESIRIVNLAGDTLEPTAMSLDFATRILEITAEVGQMPTDIATDFLKKELQELF
ncbi:MAG TPA: hypothetical protein PLP27_12830 [Crocinitomicaceae bacterium]|nr:hypothetical protein [Crocinitomicaceae bacterium]